jgi:uridylate kinase
MARSLYRDVFFNQIQLVSTSPRNYYGAMAKVTVLSLGGSMVVPESIDVPYLIDLKKFIISYLDSNADSQLILVIGGGRAAREYQQAVSAVYPEVAADELDWTGIYATRLNARMIKSMLGEYCEDPIVEDPTAIYRFSGRVLVAAGWKPGFSTDFDAVILAEEFGADFIVNMTNIEKVYTADPKEDPTATPVDRIVWSKFLEITGNTRTPGMNTPFDPIAANHAAKIGLTVVSAHGKNLENVSNILNRREYVGTTIVPD